MTSIQDLAERANRTLVLDEVSAERDRQLLKWGHQHHPAGTGPDTRPLADIPHRPTALATPRDLAVMDAHTLAICATEITDLAASQDQCTWADILLEEVFEALAAGDTGTLRNELIQVAAVAVQIAEEIDSGVLDTVTFTGQE